MIAFFFVDLTRMARKGRATLLRVGYAAALLLCMALVHQRAHVDGVPPTYNTEAAFAEAMLLGITAVQLAAVLLLTPPLVAGAIVEEKEKNTLDLLLATQLSTTGIIVGKLLSRLAQVAAILLASAPMLCLAQLWGGVDFAQIWAGIGLTACTLFFAGGISILASTICRTTWGALVASYSTIALALALISLPMLLTDIGPVTIVLLIAGQAVISLAALLLATKSLRRSRKFVAPVQPSRVSPLRQLSPVSNRPLIWKESQTVNDWLSPLAAFFVLPYTGIVLFLYLPYIWHIFPCKTYSVAAGAVGFVHGTAVGLAILLASILCLAVAFRASDSVVREKQRRTLDDLLMAPITGRDILFAKWFGSMWGMRWLGLMASIPVGLAVLALACHPLSALLFGLTILVYVSFLASVGLCISCLARTRVQANFLMALTLIGVVIGTAAIDVMQSYWHWHWRFAGALVPLGPWMLLAHHWPPPAFGIASFDHEIAVLTELLDDPWALQAMLGLAFYLLMGALCRLIALATFSAKVRDDIRAGRVRRAGIDEL